MKIIAAVMTALVAVSPLASSFSYAKELTKDPSQYQKPATVKVLVLKDKPKVLLEIKGRYQIYNPDDSVLVDTGILSKRSEITPSENGLQWAEMLPTGLSQFRVVPGDSQTVILVNGVQYAGCLEAYEHEGKVSIINEVDVENYLKATLSPLFAAEKNSELLDAIAITARTNIYYTVTHNPYSLWHVDAADVGYQGMALTGQNPKLDKSIETTRQLIMTFNNSPFAALWTKDSAGKTATAMSILRKEVPAPTGIQVPIALRERENHQWTSTITKEQLAKIAGTKNVTSIDLFLDKPSGKVYAVRIHDGFNTKDVDFVTLQKALGLQKLPSNDFSLAIKKDNILLSGFGEGLGVGLCLYSARVMAEHGEKAPKILSTFFPQTQIEHKKDLK